MPADLVRVCAPDGAVREVDGLTGHRYRSPDGAYLMRPADARKLVAVGGFVPSLAGITRRATGYRCHVCGFGTYFRRCGRCGGDCERESHAEGRVRTQATQGEGDDRE